MRAKVLSVDLALDAKLFLWFVKKHDFLRLPEFKAPHCVALSSEIISGLKSMHYIHHLGNLMVYGSH